MASWRLGGRLAAALREGGGRGGALPSPAGEMLVVLSHGYAPLRATAAGYGCKKAVLAQPRTDVVQGQANIFCKKDQRPAVPPCLPRFDAAPLRGTSIPLPCNGGYRQRILGRLARSPCPRRTICLPRFRPHSQQRGLSWRAPAVLLSLQWCKAIIRAGNPFCQQADGFRRKSAWPAQSTAAADSGRFFSDGSVSSSCVRSSAIKRALRSLRMAASIQYARTPSRR